MLSFAQEAKALSDLVPISTPSPEGPGGLVRIGTCPYCGHALVEGYYFCLACATPFRDVEMVLPAVPPRQLTDGELIDRKVPQIKTLFWTYFGVLLGCAVLGLLLSYGAVGETSEPNIILIIALQEVGLIVTTIIFTVLYWRSLAVQFKRLGFLKPAFGVALPALAGLLVINYGYHSWLESLVPDDGGTGLVVALREAGMSPAMLVVVICVFPAIIEEIAFRGLLQHWLQTAVKPWKAIVLASFLFTLLHFTLLSFFYIFAVGMLLGWTKYRTRSLYPPILLHFVHNFVVLAYFS
jgi:membrane protease YdiL (CAAX protease family)